MGGVNQKVCQQKQVKGREINLMVKTPPKKVKKSGYHQILLTPEQSGSDTTPSKQSHYEILLSPQKYPSQTQKKQPLILQTKQSEKLSKISLSNFRIYNNIIGIGSIGQVFLAELIHGKLKDGQLEYAIKRMQKKKVEKNGLHEYIQIQKKIRSLVKSKFITHIYSCFRDANYYYEVMEWARGGDIYSLICSDSLRPKMFKSLGEPAIRFIIGCVVLGLEQLHNEDILYNDLKPENVLLFEDGYVKLTDFGSSRILSKENSCKLNTGTPMYFPPEVIARQSFGKEVDLWKLGVLAYQLSNFTSPFTLVNILDKQSFLERVNEESKRRTWMNIHLSSELKDFINRLLRRQPRDRLGANSWQTLKAHSFFHNVHFDWEKLERKQLVSPLIELLDEKMSYATTFIQGELSLDISQNNILEISQDRCHERHRITISNWTELSEYHNGQ